MKIFHQTPGAQIRGKFRYHPTDLPQGRVGSSVPTAVSWDGRVRWPVSAQDVVLSIHICCVSNMSFPFRPLAKRNAVPVTGTTVARFLPVEFFDENITEYLIACDPGPIKEMR